MCIQVFRAIKSTLFPNKVPKEQNFLFTDKFSYIFHVMDAKTSANELLESIWGERGFPVDPVWIAAQLGLDVIETDLPESVSGALIKDKEKDPVIVLSKSDSKNRKRFSCAHEIGHYADRLNQDGEQYEYVDLRGQQASAGTNPDEIFANQFAAALLMPEDEVKRLVKAGTATFLMAQHFGVSDDAIRYRLKNLGLRTN